ncbi:MAG: hypothetical protein ACM3RX_04475 [Methanococcaceae archaeon]
MGLFNKYFKKDEFIPSIQDYLSICYKASEIIRKDEYLNIDSCGEELYDQLREEESKLELDSLIISFVLMCFRLRQAEKLSISIDEYWFNHKELKNVANAIIENTRRNQKISQLFKNYNIDDVIDIKIITYFHERINKYSEYITYIINPINPPERFINEANFIELIKQPFKNISNLSLFVQKDYPNQKNTMEEKCSDNSEISYSVYKAQEFIIKSI